MLDEPLGALDRTLREDLLNELRIILHRTKIPAIYVTHDQEEAFAIADRILILHDGTIVRDGTSAEVSAKPGSAFVAEFLGLGNVIEAVYMAKRRFRSEYGMLTARCGHKHSKGEKVHLLARPAPAGSEANTVSGVVSDVLFQQDRYKVALKNGLYFHMREAPRVGRKVSVRVTVECLAV
jgi:ABC-type Fe3+/spermidine/putrescine transport system ATPase subunit